MPNEPIRDLFGNYLPTPPNTAFKVIDYWLVTLEELRTQTI